MVTGNHAHGNAGGLRGGNSTFCFRTERVGDSDESVKRDTLARRYFLK